MKTVVIGYSKTKLGLTLCLLAYMVVAPVVIYFALPTLFAIDGKSFAVIATVYGTIGFGAMLGCSLLVLQLKKYKDSKEAVLLYQDGIWSNVSGIGEKLIPWSQVEQAKVLQNHKSFSMVKIELKETEEERAQRSSFSKFVKPKLVATVWPVTLEKCSFNLADIINEYTEQYNTVVTEPVTVTEKPDIQPLDEYIRKAA